PHPVRRRDLEASPVRAREPLGLAVPAVPVDRPDGVDDPARAEPPAAGDLRVAGRAATELLALLEDIGPAGAVDRTVDAAAAAERRVRRVHDRVGVLLRDVAPDELDGRGGDRPSTHGPTRARAAASRSPAPRARPPAGAARAGPTAALPRPRDSTAASGP